jgi:hypothetical protein
LTASTAGVVAVAAGAVALVSLGSTLVLWRSLRRLRSAQRVVLGDSGQDLVAHAASLQHDFQALTQYVHDVATRLDGRVGHAEVRLDGAVAYHSLIRYDAYGETGGRQSTSIALLDARRSGIVLSSIHHRDSARMYAKQVHEGRGEFELSPEENEAIRLAIDAPAQAPTAAS